MQQALLDMRSPDPSSDSPDRSPTRRCDVEQLRARLEVEREVSALRRPLPRVDEQVWYAAVQERQIGPLTLAGLDGLRARGQLRPTSLVWRDGWPVWVTARAVPELGALLGLPPETFSSPLAAVEEEPVVAPPPQPPQRSLPPAVPVCEVIVAVSEVDRAEPKPRRRGLAFWIAIAAALLGAALLARGLAGLFLGP